jgi:hypothetical protein
METLVTLPGTLVTELLNFIGGEYLLGTLSLSNALEIKFNFLSRAFVRPFVRLKKKSFS